MCPLLSDSVVFSIVVFWSWWNPFWSWWNSFWFLLNPFWFWKLSWQFRRLNLGWFLVKRELSNSFLRILSLRLMSSWYSLQRKQRMKGIPSICKSKKKAYQECHLSQFWTMKNPQIKICLHYVVGRVTNTSRESHFEKYFTWIWAGVRSLE